MRGIDEEGLNKIASFDASTISELLQISEQWIIK